MLEKNQNFPVGLWSFERKISTVRVSVQKDTGELVWVTKEKALSYKER